MNATITKFIIGVFVVIIVYYLLVYYKGGQAYLSSGSQAFNTAVGGLMQPNNRTYAKG